MNTELIIQLIILATALVGLYKAATYKSTDPEHKQSDSHGPVSEALAGLLSFFGIFAFMLAMPAFIWAFTWITGNIGKSTSSSTPVAQYSIPYEVSKTPSTQELMLVAASQIPYESSRGEALKSVVGRALEAGEVKIAILAASAIPYESTRGQQLKIIVEHIAKQTPNKSLKSGTPKSGAP